MRKFSYSILFFFLTLFLTLSSAQAGKVWSTYHPGNTLVQGDFLVGHQEFLSGSTPLVLEGTTYDDYQTHILVTDPTADNNITLPDTNGTLLLDNADSIARADLVEDSLAVYGIPLETVKNADGTSLAAAAAAGVFGINTGGWGTGTLTLDGEAASSASKTDTCWFEFVLPPEYISGQDVKLIVTAQDSVGNATVSTTLSAEVYESDGEGAVSANLYNAFNHTDITDAWQICTSVITDTSLVAGDRLVVFIRIVTDDTGGSVGTVAQIGKIELQLDIKG